MNDQPPQEGANIQPPQEGANVQPLQEGANPVAVNPTSVQQPAKLIRIGTMARELLAEIRRANLDEAGRDRLRDTYDLSIRQLGELLSPELKEELSELNLPLGNDVPTEAELRIAQAQLVGWLEGLFHGIQATFYAQQLENQARLAGMRNPGLPQSEEEKLPGKYL